MAAITAEEIDTPGGEHPLQFRLLGPVEVTDGHGHVIDVGGSKPRLVLVQLLLSPGRIVSTDALVDVLWGEDAPPTARRSLQSHVARLRAALGGDDGPLSSQSPGYVLAIDEAQVDLWRSEAFARQARTTLPSDPRHALQLARQARAEWSGDPFADLADHDPLVPQRQRLEQNRLALRELEIDALMAVGDTGDAVEQLEALVLERPQHEPFWARLMTAYYRLGRQSDALKTFGRARTALMDELGIDPSPELQRLEVAILTQADDLDFVAAESCPYKGLASYQLDDADRFCGRDDLVGELCEAVRSAPFVVVVGSSGAGKSSALRAGLMNAIEAGRIAGVAHGSVITPGPTPMRSVYRIPRTADVVIVDQFEELFTLTDDDTVQREFVRVLLASVNDGTRRVVISLRADFYGNCMRIPELAAVLARRQVVVGAMSEHELRTVIRQPAERAGLAVDGELVDAIVAEAKDHPGALPLVSHALVETWHRRADARLTLSAYREAGSLAGAIARTAENVYGGFTSEQRVQTQRLLLRLVEPGEGSEHTRRRVPFAQLEGSSIDRRVVDVLIEARLLTADGEGVEIAHEALIDAWPRLSSWIDEDRQGLRLHRHLTTAASAWAEVGRDEGELYRGVRLATALSWIGDAMPDLSQMERDFVTASVDLSERQLRQQQRANRRLRVLVAASIVGVIVAAVGTVLAVRAARDAEQGRTEAEAARIVASVRADPDLSESAVLQLAVAADGLASIPATQGLLLDTIANESGLVSRGHIDARPIGDTPISANGGVVLVQDNNVLGVVLDAETLQPRARGIRSATAVVDTGDRLVGLTGAGRSGTTKLEVVDLDTGASLGRLQDLTAEKAKVALSPDGKSLAIASPDGGAPEQDVTIYEVETGRELTVLASGRAGSIRNLTFGPDGRHLLATLDGSGALVWNTTTGARVVESSNDGVDITRLAMSPSSSGLALGRENGEVQIWAFVEGSGRWVPLDVRSPHRERVTWIDFDAEGSRIVSTSADGQAIIWGGTTGEISGGPLRFDEASAVTYFRPGSTSRLVTIDSNGATWEWELQRAGGLRQAVPGVNLGASVASTPEARVIVGSSSGVTIHDPSGGPPTEVRFEPEGAPPVGAAASADGTRVAVVRADGRVELRDIATGDLVIEFEAPNQAPPDGMVGGFGDAFVIAVDGDGSRVAYQMADGDLVIVDDDGAQELITLASWRQRLQTLNLNASGTEVVLSTTLGEAVWYDIEGIDAGVIASQGRGFDAQFVDDGAVAVIGLDGVRVIDPRHRQDVERIVEADGRRLAIDPTGHLLATVDEAGALQLWDAEAGTAIGDPLPFGRELPPTAIRFSADGHYLVAGGARETSWIDVAIADWPVAACGLVAGRLGGGDAALLAESVDMSEVCA